MTTSMLQNKTVEENPRIPSVLDQAVKSDLRKSHFNLGNNLPNYETTFNSEFYDKSQLQPKDKKDLENMGKSLRAHNYEFGDDKPDYISETKYRFAKPVINPEEQKTNRISNQLLQKTNHNFGNDKEPWNSTSERIFTPKYIPEENKNNINLVKTNFVLGDTKPDYNTINSQTYKSFPSQYVPVDKSLLTDLQSHHYKLGNNSDPLITQHQSDFQDPSILGDNFNPTLDNISLRKSNWKLGDALPSEIYNTTYKMIHTPKKAEILPKNVLRNSGLNLISSNAPLDYLTDYRDNFIPKKKDDNSQKEMNNIMKQIRRSNFSFGEAKPDYNTSSRAAFKFNPEEAKKLMVEVSGTVVLDTSTNTDNALVLARRARTDGNTEKAAQYYETVLQAEPNNWEASFFQVYFQAMQCKIIEIPKAARMISNSIPTTLRLISETLPPEEKWEPQESGFFDCRRGIGC